VNPDFIKSNYLTACSNKNVKVKIIIIIKIYDEEQMYRWLSTTKVAGRKLAVFIHLLLFENELP
jgi:hypothetical protein